MIAGEQPAKHALHPTASPLYGRTSLFKQPASADQTAAQQEQPDFGSQSSTPHTPLDTHFPQESHRLSIFGQNGISATPVANAATATPAANGNSIFSKGFGGNVSSAGSTKSYFGDSFTTHTAAGFPATPTGPRESFVGSLGNGGAPGTVDINALKKASLRGNSHEKVDIDVCLTNRFKRVEIIGIGEFSQVFMVANDLDEDKNNETLSSATNGVTTTPDANAMTPFHSPSLPVTRNMVSTIGNNEKVWAVKKSKQPFSGARDRERRAKEVEALKALKGSAHLISYEDSWEDNGHLYIQTEYCEEGSLKDFLDVTGWKGRVDDFRIWKTLLELAEGLRHIHDSGYIHLDIKPANVLIAAGGTLKIADFGLATPWPAEHGIDGEGDREYIGPEILMGRYDKPADIFALGLIIFEAASNVELPDNGLAWQKLRNGDMSDVPTLSWRDDADCPTARDTRGMPVAEAFSFLPGATTFVRPGELAQPPEFMVKPAHGSSLDFVVRWMISPDPTDRPTARQILDTFGARWVARRRRAGATIYEGNWGPADVVDDEQQEQSGEDEEMIDV
ncbi:Protein transport protein S9 plasma membrane t-SNARE [Ascosphaera pollenicola]|nr:Protein transport protein S9 plasma membrane t-SNARE [Ascosphaera pollenicola]